MKRKLLVTLVVGVLIIFTAGFWLAGSILTAPADQSIGNLPPELPGRSVEFPSESGSVLHGWLIPGRKKAGAIVLMHGVRANRLSMLERARFLSDAGYTVLLFDFQAHGESKGKQITFGHLESRDAQAAINFLRATAPDEKIGIIGVSMGGAATLLASPPLEVNAMVLEMVYPTLNQAISNRLTRAGAWASALTPLLAWQFKMRSGISVDDMRPIDHVGKASAPKLFIAGSEDRHTTLNESKQMYDAARAPKEMWIIEGAAHVDSYAVAAAEYRQRVLAFFEQYLKG